MRALAEAIFILGRLARSVGKQIDLFLLYSRIGKWGCRGEEGMEMVEGIDG
jgi:hypothetical protein